MGGWRKVKERGRADSILSKRHTQLDQKHSRSMVSSLRNCMKTSGGSLRSPISQPWSQHKDDPYFQVRMAECKGKWVGERGLSGEQDAYCLFVFCELQFSIHKPIARQRKQRLSACYLSIATEGLLGKFKHGRFRRAVTSLVHACQ